MGRSRPEPVMPVTAAAAPRRALPGYERRYGTVSEP